MGTTTNPGQTNVGHDKPRTDKRRTRQTSDSDKRQTATNPGHDKPRTVTNPGHHIFILYICTTLHIARYFCFNFTTQQ